MMNEEVRQELIQVQAQDVFNGLGAAAAGGTCRSDGGQGKLQ